MQNHECDVRWADRLEVDASGFSKVVQVVQPGASLVEQKIPLGRSIGYCRYSARAHSSNIRIDHPSLVNSNLHKVLRPDEMELEKLDHETALEMTQALGIRLTPSNPLWFFVVDDFYWLVDSITLLEQCVVTNRELLGALLSPWRSLLIRRLVVADRHIWTVARPIRSVSARRDVLGGGEWFAKGSDVCCTLHWLLNPYKLEELEHCFRSIREHRPLELPSLLPAKLWSIHALQVGRLAWIQRLRLTDDFPIGNRIITVVSDTEAFGVRVEAETANGRDSGICHSALEASRAEQFREAVTFVDLPQLQGFSTVAGSQRTTPGDRAVEAICLLPLSKFRKFETKTRAICCLRAASVLEPAEILALRVDMCLSSNGQLLPQFLALLTEAPNCVARVVEVIERYVQERSRGSAAEASYGGLNPAEVFFPMGMRRAALKESPTSTINKLLFRAFYRCGLSKLDRQEMRVTRGVRRAALRLEGHPYFPPFVSDITRKYWALRVRRAGQPV